MNKKLRLFALPAILALTAASLIAAPVPPTTVTALHPQAVAMPAPLPTLLVQAVSTDDTDAYTLALLKINDEIKAKTGIERLRHTWIGDVAGENSRGVFVVSQYASAEAIVDLQAKLQDDPKLADLLAQLKTVRHLGPSVLYKAIRFDGIYEGGAVFNTSIVCTDEEAYLKALDGLKAIFVANEFGGARINLLRAVEGRKESTHLVVISGPTQKYIAQLIDAIADKSLLKDWNVTAAKIRTTVQNGTYHEISK